LAAVLKGKLHPSLPTDVDGARVGVSGGSHGGIASWLYPVFSTHTAGGGHKPFALAMPFEGTPDLASSWFGWQFDNETLVAGKPASEGFSADAGAVPQMHAWPKSTLTKLVSASFTSGNYTALIAYFEQRTAYDQPGFGAEGRTADRFDAAVGAMLVHIGGRDCIVPGYGAIGAWEILQGPRYATKRPHDVFLYDNYPHSCSATGPRFPTEGQMADAGGYLPLWTSALSNKTDAISSYGYRCTASPPPRTPTRRTLHP
jgi:hypothetical protein